MESQPTDVPSLEPCDSADAPIENSSLPASLATDAKVLTDQSVDIHNEISHTECQIHMSAVLNQQPKTKRILDLLPTTLPPPNCPNEDDEGFIDLGKQLNAVNGRFIHCFMKLFVSQFNFVCYLFLGSVGLFLSTLKVTESTFSNTFDFSYRFC